MGNFLLYIITFLYLFLYLDIVTCSWDNATEEYVYNASKSMKTGYLFTSPPIQGAQMTVSILAARKNHSGSYECQVVGSGIAAETCDLTVIGDVCLDIHCVY